MKGCFPIRSIIRILPCLVLLLIVAGCGGGNTASHLATTSGTGRATFTVTWPARTRLVPDASNSIAVVINQGITVVARQTLARPASGATSTVSFNLLPVGTLSVTATAFPNTDGTGVAQASASAPLVTVGGQNTPFSLTMNSTIAHIDLTSASASVGIGSTLPIIATAKDASGAVVLVSSTKLSWKSLATGIASVDGSGIVTGVAVGSASITVTDSESGKSAQTTLAVKTVAPIAFRSAVLYSVPSPNEIVTADFDSDGKIDIVVGTSTALMILYGNGDGTFGTPQTILTWSGGISPYSAVDMNGDGKPDLVCTVSSQVLVLTNTGGRAFGAPVAIPCNSSLGALATADFNGDGKKDIAVVAYNHIGSTSTDIFIFLNQGAGVYTQGATLNNIWIITGMKTADLNADGKADLLVSITTDIVGTSGSSLYLGDGAGHFNGGGGAGTATANVDQTTVADFSGDGIMDYAIANSNDGSVSVIFGKGGGTFGTPANYGVGPYPDHLFATDLDGDGRPDIVVESRDATYFTVMRNQNGLFPNTVQFPIGSGFGCGPLTVADFNGDGKPDVVISSTSGNGVAVVLNNTP